MARQIILGQIYERILIGSSDHAAALAPYMIVLSCCHFFEPLPDGLWELSVKPEFAQRVRDYDKEHGINGIVA